MTERHTSNYNHRRTHEGAPLEYGAQVEHLPSPEILKTREVGQAAINTTLMRRALLMNTQLQVLEQERNFYPDPVAKEDIVQNNYDLAR